MAGKSGKGGGARKIGRSKVKCARYLSRHQREKNKNRRIKKHLKFHPNDKAAEEALRVALIPRR